MPVQLCKQAYHFTHAGNLPGIAQRGLLSHGLVQGTGLQVSDLSDPAVQARRRRLEPMYQRPIHDYVPLYLNPRNAMLYRRRNCAGLLVMLAVEIVDFLSQPVVFTDGNAACAVTRFGTCISVAKPAIPALAAHSWADLADGKRQRCAEMLIPDCVPVSSIHGVYCLDPRVRDYAARVLQRPTTIDPSLFFQP